MKKPDVPFATILADGWSCTGKDDLLVAITATPSISAVPFLTTAAVVAPTVPLRSGHRKVIRYVVALLLAGQMFGTTYYVSSSTGSDSNAGTSASQPWKTIQKVSTGPSGGYNAGDSILFKNADTWCPSTGTCAASGTFTATLTTPSAGSSSSRITYGTYGSGEAPILDGNNSFDPLMSISRSYVTVNGLRLQNSRGNGINFSMGQYAQILNVYTSNIYNWSFLSYSTSSGTALLSGNMCTSTTNYVKIGGCIITQGPQLVTATYNVCHFDNLDTVNSGSNVICIEINGSSNSVIQYNQAYGGVQAFTFKPGSVGYTASVSNGIISDNYSYRGQRFGNSTTSGNSCVGTVSGDGEMIELEGSATNLQSNITVARNVMIGKQSTSGNPGDYTCSGGTTSLIGIYYSQGAKIYGNVLICPCGNGRAIAFEAHATGEAASVVYNNTIAQDTTGVTITTKTAILGVTDGRATFRNNIIYNFAVGISCSTCSLGTEDYDMYYLVPTRGITLGSHSQTIDPRFANSAPVTANDVKLQANSPAVGTSASASYTLPSPYNMDLDPSTTGWPSAPYGIAYQGTYWDWGALTSGSTATTPRTLIKGAIMNGAVVP